ncbi:MAG: hypothetical protein K0B00_01660 [Rhodobacteraceae bacterium]|nr:hypothetical protein [Paracoccaceae bacterium]
MTATITPSLAPDTGSDAAIAAAVAAHLARYRARVVQLICGPGAEWAANLHEALRHLNPERVVLVLGGALDLPAGLAPLRTICTQLTTPQHRFTASDLAAALDRLPHLEDAVLFVLLPEHTAPLSEALAEILPAGPGFAPWLARFAAAQRDAACGGGVAG